MKKVRAEGHRDIDFTHARRGAVTVSEPGKTKISIRLDNHVLAHFKAIVDRAGDGNYQTLINDALAAHIERASMLEVVRQVVREEVAGYASAAALPGKPRRRIARRAATTA